MPSTKQLGGNTISDTNPLQTQVMGGEVELSSVSLASLVAELNEITTALAGLPASLGQQAAADSTSVVLASDQGPLTVGGITTVIKPTIAVDTGIYAALDVLGALVVSGVVTITGAARSSGGTGLIQSVTVFDDDNEKAAITLLFFDATPASGTYVGNGALALSTGDKAKYVGKVNILASDYETVGGEALACIRNIALPFKCVGSANLFMIPVVSSGTPTFTAATDLQMAIGILQDV